MEKNYNVNARSKKNGIVFYSNTNPLIGSETTRDESGEIRTRAVYLPFCEFKDNIGMIREKGKFFDKKAVLIFDVLLVTVCMLTGNIWFLLAAAYFSITISFDFFELINYIYQMKSKKGTMQSVAKYHAAEHMVINSYEKLKRIPTFEEVKKASRFSKTCGSRLLINKVVIYLLVSLSMAFVADWNIYLYLLLCVLIPITGIFADKNGWLRFLQVFVTAKPSDEHIELAIEGIKRYEEMEQSNNSGKPIVIEISDPDDFGFMLFF